MRRRRKTKNSFLRKLKENVLKETNEKKEGELLFNIAEIYYDLKKYRFAIKYYENAIKYPLLPSAFAAAYDMLGSLHQEGKNYKKATYYHKLSLKKKQPINRKAAIYTNLGRIYFNIYRRNNAAFPLFKKALTLFNSRLEYYDKDFVDHCHFCLGIIYHEKNDADKARQHYKEVLKLNNPHTNNFKIARKYLKEIDI